MDDPARTISRDVCLVVALALLARLTLALWLPHDDTVFWDQPYWHYAKNLAAGQGFWMPNPYGAEIGLDRAYAFRPPLFPFLWGCVFAVTGGAYAPIRIAHAVLSSLACGLAYLAGRELFPGSRKIAFLGGGLCALYPPLIWHSVHLMTEPLFIFFTTALLLALFRFQRTRRMRWVVLAGFAAGLGILSRSVLAGFLPFAAIWLWWVRGRGRRALAEAALFVGVAAACMSPWVIRNAVHFHAFVPTTTDAGHGFYVANNAHALHDRRGFWMPESWAFAMKPGETSVGEVEMSRRLTRLASAYLVQHPGAAVKLMARRFATLWRFYPSVEFVGRKAAAVYGLSYVPLFPFILFGLWLAHRKGRAVLPNVVLVDLLVLYTTGMSVLFLAMMRYRVPLMPFLLMFAALGLCAAWEHIRGGGGKTAVDASGGAGEESPDATQPVSGGARRPGV